MAKLTRWALACAAACLAFCGVAAGAATKLYIVRFHDTATADAPAEVQAVFKELYARHENGQHKDWHAVPEAEFERIFSGAAVRMSESAADWLRSHPSVADIEEDQEFHIIEPIHSLPKPVDMLQLQKSSKRDLGSVNPAVSQRRALQTTSIRSQSGEAIERFGLWSLDRIDQANACVYSAACFPAAVFHPPAAFSDPHTLRPTRTVPTAMALTCMLWIVAFCRPTLTLMGVLWLALTASMMGSRKPATATATERTWPEQLAEQFPAWRRTRR